MDAHNSACVPPSFQIRLEAIIMFQLLWVPNFRIVFLYTIGCRETFFYTPFFVEEWLLLYYVHIVYWLVYDKIYDFWTISVWSALTCINKAGQQPPKAWQKWYHKSLMNIWKGGYWRIANVIYILQIPLYWVTSNLFYLSKIMNTYDYDEPCLTVPTTTQSGCNIWKGDIRNVIYILHPLPVTCSFHFIINNNYYMNRVFS